MANIVPSSPMASPMRTIYVHRSTSNKSFLDMSNFLRSIGIKNNEFMLALLDPDLAYIDPHDPNLNVMYKQKVLREVLSNYWYYLREVVRIPSQGGEPMKYQLNRANLAYNFCSMLNLNSYLDCSRQTGKTIGVLCRYLYIYNFGTTNSRMVFMNKSFESSKENLQSLKEIRDILPPYLQFTERIDNATGKADRGRDSSIQIANPFNNNSIKCLAGATSINKAASVLRGKTLPLIYFDEYGFLLYNSIIYRNGAPAFSTAAANAKRNGAPYGITITSTPGYLSTDEGKHAYDVIQSATPFTEAFYDFTYPQLMQVLDANKSSDYVYIKYSYQELGKSEEWFKGICKLLGNSWPDIRREILLEWNTGVTNSPFDADDLEVIRTMVKQPISVVYLLGKYRFETYLQADTTLYPPIIGVDVSGALKQDSSTITIIDSKTTKVLACLNCNYISSIDLARCIEFIVKSWMPNAIVSVERNGGFGLSVIANLIKAGLRKNLYYEIKDVVQEERIAGVHSYKQKIKTRVYGINSTKDVRKDLIELLLDRVQFHKDKFISPIIYNELIGMEIKRNGKIEHSDSTHDDQVFSYLMALAVLYKGTNITERYGIKRVDIPTDDDTMEQLDYFEPNTMDISNELNANDEMDDLTNQTITMMNNPHVEQMKEFMDRMHSEDRERLMQLVNTPLVAKGYKEKYNIPQGDDISRYFSQQSSDMDSKFMETLANTFYSDSPNTILDESNTNVIPAGLAVDINDDSYSYYDHFNF